LIIKKVTSEDLEYGLSILARILDTRGDAVWPLFERLERELADMESRRGRVEKHLLRDVPASDREQDGHKTSLRQDSYKLR